ncbi:nucleoside hydrolase [Komagataeibacter rhaeticus]|nr:nucleoside hydrolase [Komagataeibacter rhaeticus]
MTNLALAQRLDPEFASLAKELVYMGGSLNPHQQLSTVAAGQYAREFVNSPRREFNLRFDPEAASIVMHAPWHKITMVPSDPATATELSADFLHRIASRNADISRLVAHWQPGSPCGMKLRQPSGSTRRS